jgi:integrase
VSGIGVPEDAARELEERWEEYLRQLPAATANSGETRPARRNTPWERYELILALDLYVRHNGRYLSEDHPGKQTSSRVDYRPAEIGLEGRLWPGEDGQTEATENQLSFPKGEFNMKAWVFQDAKQVAKHGTKKASWYVGLLTAEGKRRCKGCGSGTLGKLAANKLRDNMHVAIASGKHKDTLNCPWDQFRQEYEEKVLAGKALRTRTSALSSLRNFKRVAKPMKVSQITTRTVDDFIAVRRGEKGMNRGSVLSPASINHDLRHLKAALKVARSWKYLAELPEFRMEREPKKLVTYVTGDHFALIYKACGVATMPERVQQIDPADWWRALLTMAYMTGWRIGDLLALRRQDVNLDQAIAVSRAENNKGKRDELFKLHPVVVEHLRKLPGFSPVMFPWTHNQRTLYSEFWRIQKAAGINLPCPDNHEHTPACHYYGFHDLRRAFATMNADKLTPDALQNLMRHRSYQTTQKYISMPRQMDAAVASLHVPDVLKVGIG